MDALRMPRVGQNHHSRAPFGHTGQLQPSPQTPEHACCCRRACMGMTEAPASSISLRGTPLRRSGVAAALGRLRHAPAMGAPRPCMAVTGRRAPRAAGHEHARHPPLRADATRTLSSSTGGRDSEDEGDDAASLALLDLPSRPLTDLAQDMAAAGAGEASGNGADSNSKDSCSHGSSSGAGSRSTRPHPFAGAAGDSEDGAAAAQPSGAQDGERTEAGGAGVSGRAAAAAGPAGPQKRERGGAPASFPWLGWQRTRRGARTAGASRASMQGSGAQRAAQTDGAGAAAAAAHAQSEGVVVREVQPGGAASSAWPRLQYGSYPETLEPFL